MDKQLFSQGEKKGKLFQSAKECAYIAVFVALVIAVQFAFSFVPGVELVTVMFVCYSFVMGVKRSVVSATAFSVLRQLVFGFYPTVLVLYLIYFNLLVVVFALLGKKITNVIKFLPLLLAVACLCTVLFTMTDNILTPLWYGYTQRATKIYFKASIPFMVSQVICTAISVAVLTIPLNKAFNFVKNNLQKSKPNN